MAVSEYGLTSDVKCLWSELYQFISALIFLEGRNTVAVINCVIQHWEAVSGKCLLLHLSGTLRSAACGLPNHYKQELFSVVESSVTLAVKFQDKTTPMVQRITLVLCQGKTTLLEAVSPLYKGIFNFQFSRPVHEQGCERLC